jgi:cell wall-associated NlpC family hydrolase
VQQQLGELALQNSQLVEKFDQAQVVVQTKQRAVAAAQQVLAKENRAFDVARANLGATAAAEYESGAFSATGALLSSDSGQSYLDQLQTLSMISSHTEQVVRTVIVVQKSADAAKKQADSMLASAKAKLATLAQKRTAVEKQLHKYTTLLNTLTAAQRFAYSRTINPSVSSAQVNLLKTKAPAINSKAAAQAVHFALDQVGKPYVYGAAGPSTYDCSGLTMRAWGSAGVSLPHSAADQYNYGKHVSYSELQPGDLLFYYSPIGHVTIYVGDGLMVSAPQSGEDVSVVPANQNMGSYVGATRLTG